MEKKGADLRTSILLADVRGLADEALFERLLRAASPERRHMVEACRFEKNRQLSLAGGTLLDRLLEESRVPSEIVHDAQGRPLVAGRPDLHVSLTHAYPYAAAVISADPCGIDLENRGRDLEKIAAHYYTERERACAGDDPGRRMDIWCRKECLIKCTGQRDIRHMDSFAIPEGYAYVSIPLEGFSFEVLIRGTEYRYRRVEL